MEHLVKRNPDYLNDPAEIQKYQVGERSFFTQTRVGLAPFATGPDNYPSKVQRGDILWIMETGYGVFTRSKVTHAGKVIPITDLNELSEVRRSFGYAFQMQTNYWKRLEKDVLRAQSNEKPLYFAAVEHEITDTSFEPFPIETQSGNQTAWEYLNSETKRERFSLRGKVSVEERLADSGDDGNIPTRVCLDVQEIWQGRTVIGEPIDQGVEFDHHIPKSVGGPGGLRENVVPMPWGFNRVKSNRIPKGLVLVAQKEGLGTVSQENIEKWDSSTTRIEWQERVARGITRDVRKLPLEEQRAFYLGVLMQSYSDVATKFKRTGFPLPDNFDPEEYRELD